MNYLFIFLCILEFVNSEEIFKKPSILVGILARNKAHTLPYTLSYLENLDYPKDRIALW